MQENNIYDCAIVGSGPAGYTASMYASRYKLKNIVFGKIIGGTITEAHKVCNYPGLPDISGIDLGYKFHEQAKDLGGEYSSESVVSIEKEGDSFKLLTDRGTVYFAKTVILASGTERNKLIIPGEDKYLGKGVSYCATCDAAFYKDKVVGVVGGSNAATMAATLLSDLAKQVYIIYRGSELRGEPAWVEQVLQRKNVSIIFKTVLTGIEGNDKLERIKLSVPYNGSDSLELDGLFIEIGSEPNATLSSRIGIELDEKKFVKVDNSQATSMRGIWAAGDCTTNSNGFYQVVTSASQGAVAANSVFTYLKEMKSPS